MFKTKSAPTETVAPPALEPPFSFRAPLDKASIIERCRDLPDGAAVAQKLIDMAEASFETVLPPIDYEAAKVRDAITAVRLFLAENGSSRFIRDDRGTRIDGAAAGYRFSVDGQTCWMISLDVWPEIVGARIREDFEAALADAGVLMSEENVDYFPGAQGIITHKSRRLVSKWVIQGAERRGFIVNESALNQIPVEPANVESEARRAIAQVAKFLSQHGARFRPLDADANGTPPTLQLAGWRSGYGDAAEFWVLPHIWKWEVCAGFDPVKVARVLESAKFLDRGSSDELQCLKKIAGAPRLYRRRLDLGGGPVMRLDTDEAKSTAAVEATPGSVTPTSMGVVVEAAQSSSASEPTRIALNGQTAATEPRQAGASGVACDGPVSCAAFVTGPAFVTSNGPITRIAGRTNAQRQKAYRERCAARWKDAGVEAPRRIRSRRNPAPSLTGAKGGSSPTKPVASASRQTGRPTKFQAKYSRELIEAAQLGISLLGFAGKVGVTRSTITNWAESNPEFFVALMRSKAARCYGLEVDAVTIRRKGGSPGQATMAMFQMKNLAGEEYADRKSVGHARTDGGALEPEPAIFIFNFYPRSNQGAPGGDVAESAPSVATEETASG
jgi:hypothetical protein